MSRRRDEEVAVLKEAIRLLGVVNLPPDPDKVPALDWHKYRKESKAAIGEGKTLTAHMPSKEFTRRLVSVLSMGVFFGETEPELLDRMPEVVSLAKFITSGSWNKGLPS